jgi:hypothetical protein
MAKLSITIERLEYLQKHPEAASKIESVALVTYMLAGMSSEPIGEVYQPENTGICAPLGPSVMLYQFPQPGQKLYIVPPAPAVMRDHQIRELVNQLRDIAMEYHGTQQLREKIARTIRSAISQDDAPFNFDPEKIQAAIDSGFDALPAGVDSFGEFDKFMRSPERKGIEHGREYVDGKTTGTILARLSIIPTGAVEAATQEVKGNNLRDEIRSLDLDQLRSLREFVGGLITRKEDEPRRTVWRVCSDGICLGNFKEDEYLKAATFLLEKANEIDTDPLSDRRDRRLEVLSHLVIESEYETWFDV